MVVYTLTVGKLRAHCYIVFEQGSDVCTVIDPGAESAKIMKALEQLGLSCKAVLLTHAHPDHAGAVGTICKETGALLYLHPEGASFAREFARTVPESNRFASMLTLPYAVKTVTDGDMIEAESLCFQVLSCPGHTPDGLSYLCGNTLFTGDTLFKGTCGRWDLPKSDAQALRNSLQKLASLPGNPDVYPGHGSQTTLERERQENPSFSNSYWEPEDDILW